MPTLLHLDSSAGLDDSVSRALTGRFASAWTASGPTHRVLQRDLHRDPLPHLPTSALHWAAHLRPAGSQVPPAAEALQQRLIQEVLSADVVLIGAPLYNWSLPSTLKAWVDYIQVGGLTSTFGEPTQPFAGKPVVIVSSRGGQYGPGTGNEGTDHAIPALQQALGVALGMELSTVTVELTLAATVPGMAELKSVFAANLAAAETEIESLVRCLAGCAPLA